MTPRGGSCGTCRTASAGGSAVLVDPRGTSRRCSGCGSEPDMPRTLADGGARLQRLRSRPRPRRQRHPQRAATFPGTGNRPRPRSTRVAAQHGRAVAFRRRACSHRQLMHLDAREFARGGCDWVPDRDINATRDILHRVATVAEWGNWLAEPSRRAGGCSRLACRRVAGAGRGTPCG